MYFLDTPVEWKQLWETAPELPELHLPEPNKFITTNFEILPPESTKNHPVSWSIWLEC
jgi:secreted Zn-dependent insulinase-like peptidase